MRAVFVAASVISPGMLAPASAALLIVLGILAVTAFNKMGRQVNQVTGVWKELDAALVTRREVAGRLAAAVAGRMPARRAVADAVTAAAGEVPGGQSPARTAAETRLGEALAALVAEVDAAPDAGDDVAGLRAELAGSEEEVARLQELHGLAVELYNNARRAFPQVLVAGLLGFAREDATPVRLATR